MTKQTSTNTSHRDEDRDLALVYSFSTSPTSSNSPENFGGDGDACGLLCPLAECKISMILSASAPTTQSQHVQKNLLPVQTRLSGPTNLIVAENRLARDD